MATEQTTSSTDLLSRTEPNYRLSLLCLLSIKLLLMVFVIQSSAIGLGPDEAHYWLWGKNLALGYYSKPPGIAWASAFFTALFGNTELGVRAVALLFGTLLPLAVYQLAISANLRALTAFWAGAIMAFCPLGILATFLATTDAPMVVMWTMALGLVVDALRKKSAPNYPLIGGYLAIGALFKWTAYIFWPLLFLLAWFFPRLRDWRMGFGILFSLLALLPSLLWNQARDWPTWQHVLHQSVETGSRGNFFSFVGAQIALLSPLLFALLVYSLWQWWEKRGSRQTVDCLAITTLTILGVYISMSLFRKMQGNWCVFVYPSAIVLLSWIFCEVRNQGIPWLFAGLLVGLFSAGMVFALPALQSRAQGPSFLASHKINPFKHSVGWGALNAALEDLGYAPKEQFLFADSYQTASILSFYGPEQGRAYHFPLSPQRKNQFSYWPTMVEEQVGNTGIYVDVAWGNLDAEGLEERAKAVQESLFPYFENVTYLGRQQLFSSFDQPVKWALFFQATNYQGGWPATAQDNY